jgi:hypothetical protein
MNWKRELAAVLFVSLCVAGFVLGSAGLIYSALVILGLAG